MENIMTPKKRMSGCISVAMLFGMQGLRFVFAMHPLSEPLNILQNVSLTLNSHGGRDGETSRHCWDKKHIQEHNNSMCFSLLSFYIGNLLFHLSTESVFSLKIAAGCTYPAMKVCSDSAQLEEIWHLEE